MSQEQFQPAWRKNCHKPKNAKIETTLRPRRIGGHDLLWWSVETGYLDASVDTLPAPEARLAANVLAQVEKQTGKKPVTERPADLLAPGMEGYRKQCVEKGLPTDDETVVLFAMFPQQVEALQRWRDERIQPIADKLRRDGVHAWRSVPARRAEKRQRHTELADKLPPCFGKL